MLIYSMILQLNAEPHELLELGANGHEMKEWRQSMLGAYNRKRWVGQHEHEHEHEHDDNNGDDN